MLSIILAYTAMVGGMRMDAPTLSSPKKETLERLERTHPEFGGNLRTDWFAKGIPDEDKFILLNTLKESVRGEVLQDGVWLPTTFSAGVPSVRTGRGLRMYRTGKDGKRQTAAYKVSGRKGYWLDIESKTGSLALYELK